MVTTLTTLLLQLNHTKPTFHRRNNTHFNYQPIHLTNISFPFLPSKPLQRSFLLSGISSNTSREPLLNQIFSPESILLYVYIAIFLFLRLLSSLLPPDFPQRWHNLIVSAEKAEADAKSYPSHLFQAVVAYEDRRFFRHCGVDPVGVARAVLLFPGGGGGSTITQQLVKNNFLTNDRTFSRKAIEMLLALSLERKLTKSKILSSYLSKIYWGHGIYGIVSASKFYFGKHPRLLSLDESAMLVGIIPAPELRSPFNELSRGKASQARALRRMVDVGVLDVEAALWAVNRHLQLHGEGEAHLNRLLYSLKEEQRNSGVQGSSKTSIVYVWDWESQSKIWEIREDMERWAMKARSKYCNRVNKKNILTLCCERRLWNLFLKIAVKD